MHQPSSTYYLGSCAGACDHSTLRSIVLSIEVSFPTDVPRVIQVTGVGSQPGSGLRIPKDETVVRMSQILTVPLSRDLLETVRALLGVIDDGAELSLLC